MKKIYETQIPFGKHKGEMLGDLIAEHKSYIIWLSEQYFVKKNYKNVYDAAVVIINNGDCDD